MDNKVHEDRRLGLLLAFVVICSFIYFLFNSPEQNPTLLAIVRFLAAIASGLSGYLITGTLNLGGKLRLYKLTLQAGGAFAAFILVFLLFFVGVPTTTPDPEIFKNTTIESKIPSVVSAPRGNGATLEVELKNIPRKIKRVSDYKVAAFARPDDNPNWYFQDVEDISEKLSFPLRLWDKGDKLHYSAIVIISSSNSQNLEKIKTQTELDNAAIKKSRKVRFYRNDEQP